MDMNEAAQERHAVRRYDGNRKITGETRQKLEACIQECNRESGLHIQLVSDEPKAFGGMMAHYGKFSGVSNYLALVGKKGKDEACGYYGEKIVLLAQSLGLNTCWVALSYSKVKGAYTVLDGEKLYIVISIGYGMTQGVSHHGKSRDEVMEYGENPPAWFLDGVDAALLAPTAMNQQKFSFSWDGNKVTAKSGNGFYTKIDLGIAKCHFELGAGKGKEIWN